MILMFRIEEIFDVKRFIASEHSINISYKLPRTGDQEGSISRQPMIAKLRETKAFSEPCKKMEIIQRLSSDAKKECFGILRQHRFPNSPVQFLAVEEGHEVVSSRNCIVFNVIFLQIRFFLEAADHPVLFQAVVDLDRGIRELLDPQQCLLLCRTCLQMRLEEQRDEVGTFDLRHPLHSLMHCNIGHRLPQGDLQFFSGISRSYHRYECAPNATTVILNGAMKITCKDQGFSVDARIARFEDFEETTSEMNKESMVSQCRL